MLALPHTTRLGSVGGSDDLRPREHSGMGSLYGRTSMGSPGLGQLMLTLPGRTCGRRGTRRALEG